jgi:hypothetical protein
VRAGFATGEQVLAVGAEEPVRFYARPLATEGLWLGHVANPGRMEQKLDEALARARGTWVVLSRAEDLDPEGRFAAALDRRFPDVERWAGEGVRLWHLPGMDRNRSQEAGRHPAATP